jgi:hypothetical protein
MGLVGLGYVDRPKPGVTYANAMLGVELKALGAIRRSPWPPFPLVLALAGTGTGTTLFERLGALLSNIRSML